MTYLGEKARDLASTFTVPFFALHGTADNICDKQLSKNFFEKSPVLHKQFQVNFLQVVRILNKCCRVGFCICRNFMYLHLLAYDNSKYLSRSD